MSQPSFDIPTAHRWFAIELNNSTWSWLEAESYDGSGAAQVIHAAHASCHHWLQVGNAANHARAECLVGNVYAAIGDGSSALRHAKKCIELTKTNMEDLADWDLAFAYDVLARAHAANGDTKQADILRMRTQDLGNKIADENDKSAFDNWHRAGNWHGLSNGS